MGGEYGPLGRRHSGKGRAVPVRRPSIVRRLGQQLQSIESLNQSYVNCVQSAFEWRLDDFGVRRFSTVSLRKFGHSGLSTRLGAGT
jgi:hypothetical protein